RLHRNEPRSILLWTRTGIFEMTCSAKRLLRVAFAGMLGCAFALSGGDEAAWKPAAGGRQAPLNVPATGKTGFTLLAPEQTGLTFTNSVDEQAAAANRVLYDGSGVATGDFDNDGWPDIFFCSLNGHNTLYRNLGGWRFADVTTEAGL